MPRVERTAIQGRMQAPPAATKAIRLALEHGPGNDLTADIQSAKAVQASVSPVSTLSTQPTVCASCAQRLGLMSAAGAVRQRYWRHRHDDHPTGDHLQQHSALPDHQCKVGLLRQPRTNAAKYNCRSELYCFPQGRCISLKHCT